LVVVHPLYTLDVCSRIHWSLELRHLFLKNSPLLFVVDLLSVVNLLSVIDLLLFVDLLFVVDLLSVVDLVLFFDLCFSLI